MELTPEASNDAVTSMSPTWFSIKEKVHTSVKINRVMGVMHIPELPQSLIDEIGCAVF